MPVQGFHSEWQTIGRHRALLARRRGFPDDHLRFIARVAVEICDQWYGPTGFGDHDDSVPEPDQGRVVSVIGEDTDADVEKIQITVATTSGDRAAGLDRRLREILQSIYPSGRYEARIAVVPPGATSSLQYDHMEHLSVQAGLAVDRWSPQAAADGAPG